MVKGARSVSRIRALARGDGLFRWLWARASSRGGGRAADLAASRACGCSLAHSGGSSLAHSGVSSLRVGDGRIGPPCPARRPAAPRAGPRPARAPPYTAYTADRCTADRCTAPVPPGSLVRPWRLGAARARHEGAPVEPLLTRGLGPAGDGSGDEAGVPGFWLQAMQNNGALAEEVQKHDEVRSRLYLPYISPRSPVYLPCRSTTRRAAAQQSAP